MLQELLARIPRRRTAAIVVAVVAPLVIAATLAAVRDTADDAVVALLLVAVAAVLSPIGGRTATWTAATVGALAYDALHATPYGGLTMDQPRQVQVLVTFFVVAVLLGELSNAALGLARSAREARVREARVLRVLVLTEDADLSTTIERVVREVRDEARGTSARWLPGDPPQDASLVDREGRLVEPDDDVRASGRRTTGPMLLPVRRHGRTFGAIEVLVPSVPSRDHLIECWTLAAVLGNELAARDVDDDALAGVTVVVHAPTAPQEPGTDTGDTVTREAGDDDRPDGVGPRTGAGGGPTDGDPARDGPAHDGPAHDDPVHDDPAHDDPARDGPSDALRSSP